jgi:hypothetical protein
MGRLKTIPFALAGIWAIGASLYTLLWSTTFEAVSAECVPGNTCEMEEVIRQVSWYEAQGLWGVFILLLFALLYSSTWFFSYRGIYNLVGLLCLVAVAMTFRTGMIGLLYFPSVVAVVVGWLLLGLGKLLNRERTPSG